MAGGGGTGEGVRREASSLPASHPATSAAASRRTGTRRTPPFYSVATAAEKPDGGRRSSLAATIRSTSP